MPQPKTETPFGPSVMVVDERGCTPPARDVVTRTFHQLISSSWFCVWGLRSAVGAAVESVFVDGAAAARSLSAVPRGRWAHVHVQVGSA
jgi:hypothetical protein